MIFFAVISFLAAIFVLVARKPGRPLSDTVEYRLDNRVVAAVLFLLGIVFTAAAWLT